ncbi:MAG: hypothetical protein K1X56_14895 [Flavobacteriales bacterium]|nr:hypothetical protein [Flavobacteriales bacterium]
MNDLPRSLFELVPSGSDQQIVEETARQLIKDFAEFSFEINFTGTKGTPYQELFEQVLPVIELMLKNNMEMFHAMMYRIDVNEKQIREAMQRSSSQTFPEIVTDLILRREMMKVLTKRYFSGK